MPRKPEEREGYELIFRPYVTMPDGSRRYASQYGKKVFALWVKISK